MSILAYTYKTTKCRFCGIEFRYPKEFGPVRYCSGKCRVLHVPPINPIEYKGAAGHMYYGRGRRKKMAKGDRIDAFMVYEFYNWTCHLCNNKIDPTVVHPDPMCATLDHLHPLSRGGAHVWDNVLPAHNGCGAAKGDRLDVAS